MRTQPRRHFIGTHDVIHCHINIGDAAGYFQQALRGPQSGINVTAIQIARTQVKQGAYLKHLARALCGLHAESIPQHRAQVVREISADHGVPRFESQRALNNFVVEFHHAPVAIDIGADDDNGA